jgi:SAM-dependent methyltransferase
VGLELTGERTLPGIAHENYWFRRHEAAYRDAARRCAGLDVLDAGCGEGYGTAILAAAARTVRGVDLSPDVCRHARAAYPGVTFVEGNLCALPLPDACVDAVVALQVIEHLWDIPAFLDEVARVLRPGALFVCATPNRLTFSPGADRPTNPFHTVEFSAGELERLLATRFTVEEVRGVFHGRRLAAAEAERGVSLPTALAEDPPEAWPAWLGELVRSVTVADFTIAGAADGVDVDTSLDLVATCRLGTCQPAREDA